MAMLCLPAAALKKHYKKNYSFSLCSKSKEETINIKKINMKNIITSLALIAITFTACNSGNNKSTDVQTTNKDSVTSTTNAGQVYACPMHPEITGKKGEACSKCGMELKEVKNEPPQTQSNVPVSANTKTAVSIKEIVNTYLQLKNAFAKDNTNDAATAANKLGSTFKNFDKTTLSASQRKVFEDISDDAGEHAEHIGKNGGNIEHQREHLEMLSKDIYDLVKAFGSNQVLYKDFCPMYNKGKGAFWLSETKEIKNPYLGKAMPTCGTVKEEIK